jgi:hypothetical protein
MAETEKTTLGRESTLALLVLTVVIAGTVGYTFLNASPSPSTSRAAAPLTVSGLSLLVPQDQPACTPATLLCQSEAFVTGTVSVDGRSPLSCLDVYVNGSSEGSTCWNLNSTAFTQSACDESGNQTSCTEIVSSNTNTETNRTIALSQAVYYGSVGSTLIFAGMPYQLTLVGQFQDGTNATASAVVTATFTTRFAVSTVSATTCSTPSAIPGEDTTATCVGFV